jgi:type II secretory ATPase GspE/PulE/Tfp pilus assembly ATPase PilB-like protein
VPTADGLEDVVMRVLTTPVPMPTEDLALSSGIIDKLQDLLSKSEGLLIISGPPDSGKTTTAHSLLRNINTSERKIWTVEDPIEINQEGLRQIQINTQVNWTFGEALRVLTHAGPDVIFVGDTPDQETAKAVVEASLGGRLVLSSMRANGTADCVLKLLNFGLDAFNVADALLGVLSQRLVRRLCSVCKTFHAMSDDEVKDLAQRYCTDTDLSPAVVISRWQSAGTLAVFSRVGCEQCNHTGYKGRIGLHELLWGSPAMMAKIRARADAAEILRVAVAQGTKTLRQDGIEKMLQGQTDLHEIKTVCP